MTLDEAQYLALPEDQRQALQRQLQAQGLYSGPIDGISGNKMRAALNAFKAIQQNSANSAQQTRQLEIEAERERLRIQAAQRDAERKAEEDRINREREEKEKREAASDPLMETFVPFAAGAGVGGAYGELTNRGLNAFEAGNTRALNEIAREIGPTNKLTGSQLNRSRAVGAAQAAEKFMPSSPIRQGLATAGRAASYGIPAAVVYNEYSNYQERAADKSLPEKERKANQQIANGLLGVMTGIGAEGGRRFFFPNREQGLGTAAMRVATARDFAKRMDDADAAKAAPKPTPVQPQAPEPKAAKVASVGSRGDLLEQAKKYRIPGRSSMSAEQLRDAVADAIKKGPPPKTSTAAKLLKSPALAPIAAGAMTYNAMTSDAEAATGDVTGRDRAEAALGGAAAGGATAGGLYGARKIAEKAAQYAPNAMRFAARAAGPIGIGMTAYDTVQGINKLAHLSPPQDPSEYSTMGAFMPPQADDFENTLSEIERFYQQPQ